VTLDAKKKVTGVVAGEGRKGMTFRIQQAGGHACVVPRGTERLIVNGTADRRLFDVTLLTRERHDDAHRSDVPLIVTYDKGRSVSASALRDTGTTVRWDLPSINGDALRAHKARGSAQAFAVSYDDGRTWKKTTAVGGKHLKLRSPAKPGSASLRVTLTDAKGNTLIQTIHCAYRTTA
jgi:hypothetical protein